MTTLPIYLPNSEKYKERIKVCESCENQQQKIALGWVVVVCGVCNCPIKTKCVIGPCPKGKW
jgi:hypothetical protein